VGVGPTTVVPLKRYRFSWRKSFVAAGDGAVRVVLPTLWRRPLEVPFAEVGVLDPARAAPSGEAVFADPVQVPYLHVTSALALPNVVLLFAHPVTPPRIRRFADSNAVGLPEGDLDGVGVRTADGPTAVEHLVAAGLERVEDRDAWLERTRRVVTEPAERERVLRTRRTDRRWTLVAVALLCVGGLTSFLLVQRPGPESWGEYVPGAVGFLAVTVVPEWLERRERRGRGSS
jgi:hypothetical protein